MANFFKSPEDLRHWIKKNSSDAGEASAKIIAATGCNRYEQDIVESVRKIYNDKEAKGASNILFKILSEYKITEASMKKASDRVSKVVAADVLLKSNLISSEQHKKMIKEAQISRSPGQYQQMPLRVCPKLPKQSGGKQLISTYNCRHYCLDSLTFDDDPLRVYCAEAIWRKHVADKFSKEFKDKDGEWVGGYINNRFYRFPTAGTPANPNVPRDQGNKMQLGSGERTRQPRPHEYSTERRLSEKRNPGSTKSITLNDNVFKEAMVSQIAKKGCKKISSKDIISEDERISSVFSKIVEMQNSGVEKNAAAARIVRETGMSVEDVVKLQSLAIRKFTAHQSDIYSIIMANKINKTSQSQSDLFQTTMDVEVNKSGEISTLPEGVLVSKNDTNGVFEVINSDSFSRTGQFFSFINEKDVDSLIPYEEVLNGFEDVGEAI